MVIYSLRFGSNFQSNCYVAENDNKEAFAVDIGGDSEEFIRYIRQNGLDLKKIFLTHGHFDHILGTAAAAEEFGAEVYIHTEDAQMLSSEEKCLVSMLGRHYSFRPVTKYTEVSDGDVIDFCGTPVKVMHTPGHTRGSVCYICENMIFSGDTLFKNSMGRTDFPGGSVTDMFRSLTLLKKLGLTGDYKVYPGHEEETVLSAEIRNNPFMRDLK